MTDFSQRDPADLHAQQLRLAQEFNNVLSVILSHAQLMRGDLRPGDPFYGGVMEIVRAGERARELTRHLLALGRQQVLEPEASSDNQRAKRGNETILLVDDDDSVRTVACQILRRHGYVVLEASNAGAALLISEQHTATIHLLLTKVILPRLDGQQIADRIVGHRPEIRLLFLSDYAVTPLESGIAYLEKPITPATLALKVRQVLDA